MRGGAGDDRIIFGVGDVLLTGGESGGAGYDTAVLGTGFSWNTYNWGIYGIEAVEGNELDNIINGRTAGVDYNFQGGGGDDTLTTVGGNDILDGGAGNDTLNGGGGNDTFVFAAGSAGETDTISDFVSGTDIIQFNNAGFTTFAQVQAAMTDFTTYTLITLPSGSTIRVDGVQPSDFTSADFSFSTSAEEASGEFGKTSHLIVSEVQSNEVIDSDIFGDPADALALLDDVASSIDWLDTSYGFQIASISDVATSRFDFSQLSVINDGAYISSLQDFMLELALTDTLPADEVFSSSDADIPVFDFDQLDDHYHDALSHLSDADWQIA